jgi:hypothetical protein
MTKESKEQNLITLSREPKHFPGGLAEQFSF